MSGKMIAAIAILGTVILGLVGILSDAAGKRAVGRKELNKLREDISQMKGYMEEIREQLADIIIRLS